MLRSDHHACKSDHRRLVISDVLMPQMGLEVTEATVLEILVALGAEVAEGDPLLELETDKATTEIPAPRAGFVVALDVAVGQVVPVGAVLARLGDGADEAPGATPPADEAAKAESVAAVANGATAEVAQPADAPREGERLRAAPVARRAAQDLGVRLEKVAGTGPRGRITLRDVQRAAEATPTPTTSPAPGPPPAADDELVPLSGLRRAIARRMTLSQQIPQYQLQRDVDATHLLAQKDAQAKAGVNDLLMQAIAETVMRHPDLATIYEDGDTPALRRHDVIGVGLAVASDRGLVVPVIRDVPALGLAEIAALRAPLVAAARGGRLALDQMRGGAITLSNLGGFGVDRFAAMLNPGESAIVAVGRTVDRVVARGRGLTVAPIMTITMTFDHRTVDGAVGGAALDELAGLLEGAMTWRP
jgi:pyruvate dehydrogenase E2 component (dihydrolipoamide acetyltransferase)